MENVELINQLKYRADTFDKEDIVEIIELAGKAYFENNPFANEEEIAEQSLDNLLQEFSSLERKFIQKAKEKIISIIP